MAEKIAFNCSQTPFEVRKTRKERGKEQKRKTAP